MSQSEDEKERRFKVVLNLYQLDSQALWNVFNSFFLVHALIAGFLLKVIMEKPMESGVVIIVVILGIFLWLLWMLGYYRASQTCAFRLKQAQETEPEGWEIVGGKAKDYFNNFEITINGNKERMPFLAWFYNQYNRVFIMAAFIVLYIYVIWYLSGG